MGNFERKNEGLCGNAQDPDIRWSKEVFCKKCKVETEKIKVTGGYCSTVSERGVLITVWDKVTVKCQNCKKTGIININYRERDGSFYSVSQPDG